MKLRVSRGVVLILALSLICLFLGERTARAQGTAFTYQGTLKDTNGPVSGLYDLTFTVFSGTNGGSPITTTVTNSTVLVSHGQFTTIIDFGSGVFSGGPAWLEIGARTNGGVAFTTLAPRQAVLPVPYAIMANSASNLLGTLTAGSLSGTYGSSVTLSNPLNQFSGDGSGLQLVNAGFLQGLTVSNFWQTSGNTATSAGSSFVGTSDNQPFEFRVNGQRALLFSPDPRGGGNNTPNLTGNPANNSISATTTGGAAIAGGGDPGDPNTISVNASGSFIGAGAGNNINTNSHDSVVVGGFGFLGGSFLGRSIEANAPYSVIDGGQANTIQPNADHSIIGGGQANSVQTGAHYAVAGGGWNNVIQAGAAGAAIGGGSFNTNGGLCATVPGGANNSALGDYSLAAGEYANALHSGAFVWSDGALTLSTANDQFLVHAGGGAGIGTNNPGANLHLASATTFGFPQLRLDNTGGDYARLQFNAGTNAEWDVEAGPFFGGSVMLWLAGGNGAMLLQSNGNLNVFGNLTAGSFSGNGVLPWQTPAGASVQAVANNGYLLTNAAPVNVILPSAPNLSDIVRVSGGGNGGWSLAQNPGQSVMGAFSSGGNWTLTSAPNTGWQSIASSSDGTKLAAAPFNGPIYLSTDAGTNWVKSGSPTNIWAGIACSADGVKLAAAAASQFLGRIYTSTDSGATWTARAFSNYWVSIASSADGTHLIAAAAPIYAGATGLIYTSKDSGVTWNTTTAPSTKWTAVASSANGTNLVASYFNSDFGSTTTQNNGIYTSSDGGANWTLRVSYPIDGSTQNWDGLASSADGTKLVAIASGVAAEYIWISHDSGVSWNLQNDAPAEFWQSVASSADGSKLIAAAYNGALWISTNSGVNWTTNSSNTGNLPWSCVASSADGSKLVAGTDDSQTFPTHGQIWTWQPNKASTTTGAAGSLAGGKATATELQYIGSGRFMQISHQGTIVAN